jgi:hypothetical protein
MYQRLYFNFLCFSEQTQTLRGLAWLVLTVSVQARVVPPGALSLVGVSWHVSLFVGSLVLKVGLWTLQSIVIHMLVSIFR